MDSRIVFSGSQDRSERRKVFVEVTLKQDVDGHKIPLSIKGVLRKGEDLKITDETNLDGEATISLVYL